MSKLYIFTLTWNGIDKLTKLNKSLIPALNGLDYEWFIKDNASTDGTVDVAKSWDGNINVIAYKNNLQNFSKGMNYLFKEASPQDNDFVLLLNNDVIFRDTKSIHKMIDLMKKGTNVGAVGARLLFTDTDKLQHAGVTFHPKTHAPLHFRLNETADKQSFKNRQFQVVTGAVMLTKAEYFKSAFKNTKSGHLGMDENYHWGFDDVDLCLSIKYNMDKKIVYCGDTDIYHEESASLKKVPTNRLFLSHNLNYLRNKWRGKYCLDHELYVRDPNFNIYNG